ncbi:MAG: zinc ABC transporter substrate-binding protein [Thermoleophilia bacterium]|nr:zinc ABC transporter substrate-binding protein [Thermoleophilia bacterium]
MSRPRTGRAFVAPTVGLALMLPLVLAVAAAGVIACGGEAADDGRLQVVASTAFLADMARNVAGERAAVTSLIPSGTDPHVFQPTPSHLRETARADLVVLNGAGLESQLADMLREARGDAPVIEAAAGLEPRTPRPGEPAHEGESGGDDHAEDGEVDPHFWLDPTLAVSYVTTMRDALIEIDPAGADEYRRNAEAYVGELHELDRWIAAQIATIAPDDRQLVMNHVSHGYYADRYGLRIVGAVIPGVSSGETPSARDLAELVATVRATGVKAIFVDIGEDPGLGRQIAGETGIEVVDDLRVHSLSEPGGGAATYIEMLRHDTQRIVEALR